MALHDHMGHQGIDRTLDLLRERVDWPSMAKDAQNWVTNCRHCQIARGDYNQPKPTIGHLEAHNFLDLVCLDFTKIDPSKTGKENVLVITDAFTNIKPDTPINVYTRFCLHTAKSKFSLVSPVADW